MSCNWGNNFVNSTNRNGISIKVANGTPNNGNNFVTFRNSGGTTVGRIEGQSLSDLQNSFRFIWDNTMAALNEAFIVAEGVACGVQLDFGEVGVMAAQGATAYAHWLELAITAETNVGVAYLSGSGDYAEWLEKVNPNEVFSFGDIVGVKGGKISKSMSYPDHYMVVSMSPIVLGNMPPAGQEKFFEKIAFIKELSDPLHNLRTLAKHFHVGGRKKVIVH